MMLASAGLLTLAACATGPDYKTPVAAAPATGAFIGGTHPAFSVAEPAGEWWRLYQDPVLDSLVADAFAHNTDLRIASANLARARALLRETRADRLPQTAIGAGATYGRTPAIQTVPGLDREGDSYDVGLSVSYEVDLFGRVKRSIEAARGDADALAAARDAVRVAIAAETARAYADASAAAERLEVASRTVGLIDQTLNITTKRFEAGRGSRLDVARVASLRDRQQAMLPPLRAGRDGALFRLATLTGRAPAELPHAAGARRTILRLDQAIPVGDGRALLARRPDIRQAERRLAAEMARIGIATADLYPRITFGGSIGATGPSLGDIFTGGPFRWLLGPLVNWAFPNQEANRARIEASEASAAAALASFDGIVLNALQETETALSVYAHELDRRQSLTAAREQAGVAAKIARVQLREGKIDSLTVLDAERSLAEAEADLALSDARIATSQVDLFRALGGGWQVDAGAVS
ncbi:efflux transporter outer membrane subunit [Sphingobium boeckii]|uniref:NodT family efflux transporter outer membrane factor (OMF) lipoprotein n=1 Tax=Sphingobium boeckii TaxID=1082345 RepID=A0A7W9AJP5_9SPHN|nr:efflux transporter outer membrane subunit [Sphingobium boeckii]MBB5686818.1 NodT family efflux transporter outer membrane factor (OMF) lipoprotein [Sphingobium boeckii]